VTVFELLHGVHRATPTLSAAGNRLAVEDLMIAATALAKGHEVVTRDLRSFPRVPGLKWIEW
jgi:predicted nucleic acid-binding protein